MTFYNTTLPKLIGHQCITLGKYIQRYNFWEVMKHEEMDLI